MKTHGAAGTPMYQAWNMMLQRCNNPKNAGYANYGGRGIVVCERWNRFENFLADMGARPPGMTIERSDVDGNYEPGNCRWATDQEQKNNRRDSRHYVIGGVKKTMTEWAHKHGLKQPTVWRRLAKGDSIERALRPVTSESFSRTRRI